MSNSPRSKHVIKLPPIGDRHRTNTELSLQGDGGGNGPPHPTLGNAFTGRPRVTIRAAKKDQTDGGHLVNGTGTGTINGRQDRSHQGFSEFQSRFQQRNQTKPSVVAFDGPNMRNDSRRRKTPGFLPSMRLTKKPNAKSSGHNHNEKIDPKKRPKEHVQYISTSGRIQLAPSGYTEMKTRSMSARVGHAPPAVSGRISPLSTRTAQTAPEGIVYPNIVNDNMDYDDISLLPPPKKFVPRREVPWVFRYKVKRNMNELAKIMASKGPPLPQPGLQETA